MTVFGSSVTYKLVKKVFGGFYGNESFAALEFFSVTSFFNISHHDFSRARTRCRGRHGPSRSCRCCGQFFNSNSPDFSSLNGDLSQIKEFGLNANDPALEPVARAVQAAAQGLIQRSIAPEFIKAQPESSNRIVAQKLALLQSVFSPYLTNQQKPSVDVAAKIYRESLSAQDQAAIKENISRIAESLGTSSTVGLNAESSVQVPKEGKQMPLAGRLTLPKKVVDKSGNSYILDRVNNRIEVYAPDGSVKTISIDARVDPGEISVDESGKIFVLDKADKRLNIYDPNGSKEKTIKIGNDGVYPRSISVDKSGNIRVVDSSNRIQVFDQSGQLLLFNSDGQIEKTLPRLVEMKDSHGNVLPGVYEARDAKGDLISGAWMDSRGMIHGADSAKGVKGLDTRVATFVSENSTSHRMNPFLRFLLPIFVAVSALLVLPGWFVNITGTVVIALIIINIIRRYINR